LALYVVIPQIGSFRSSWEQLSHLQIVWAIMAIGLTCYSYLAAAGTYYYLAFKPLKYAQLVLIEVAAMFINRLLPAGIGALSTNYSYLRRRGHSQAQSATMIAANNLIGIMGHLLVIVIALVSAAGQIKFHHFWQSWSLEHLTIVAILLSAGLGLVWWKFGRHRLRQAVLSLRQPLITYRKHPLKLLGALLTSISLTVGNVLCLAACAYALSVHLPFVAVLLIFSLGVGAGTVTPTPGGLGGFEAGLFAGFVAYGVASPTALALALLYRLISYWLPLVLGALAFLVAQRQKLFSA
jgi:uncharacterized protein (TIRG00374 family)